MRETDDGMENCKGEERGSFPSTGTNNRPVYSFRFNLLVIRSKNEWEKIKLMFVGRIGDNNSTWVLHSMTREGDQRPTVIETSLQESQRSQSIPSSSLILRMSNLSFQWPNRLK